ncbi:hypothetical protein COCNU_13G004430 [Cocos nucifera]|uniref:YbaK/aminoacyl-tRNA synthetase-associated domain-containing protein n=1 Tax=Cocos nucifera TaxID=13894 RepID=A0A8K0ITK4_COCNU|nr:hypothetical protein COCNU_13G004430 [Cocos nucifera]
MQISIVHSLAIVDERYVSPCGSPKHTLLGYDRKSNYVLHMDLQCAFFGYDRGTECVAMRISIAHSSIMANKRVAYIKEVSRKRYLRNVDLFVPPAELQIDFICYDHPAVLTVEAQAKHVAHLGGALSKNLLLKDKKHRFYVVSALAGTNIDMKALSASDLNKFLTSIGRQPTYVDLEASPLVGKDNPPDLASLVPSGAPTLTGETNKAVPAQNDVSKEKSTDCAGQASSRLDLPKNAVEKTQNRVDPLAEASDVGKFVKEIIDKISTAFLLEVSKDSNVQQTELPGHSVLDGIRKRVVSDLENMTMSMKNAAYTQGFHAGFQSMLQSGIQNRSFRN